MALELTLFDYLSMGAIVVGLIAVARPTVPKAYALAVTMLGIFGIDIIAGIAGAPPTGGALGFKASEFLQGERPWSPITSIFVHAGFSHILGNMFILVTAGPALEDRIGGKRFLIIYFVAGLVALVAHTLLAYTTPIVPADALALGASGAIFGVLTAFAVRYPKERLPFFLLFFVLWLPSFVVLLIYLGMNVLYMFTVTGIAWWGHFAGFLVGLPFAYLLPASTVAEPGSKKGLPDPAALERYATTPELRRILERVRQFTPDSRTQHDTQFANAWVDKFLAKATCDQGHSFKRDGLTAKCTGGETTVDFARR